MAGGAVADGMGPAHPMSGACFLHDSGMEFIPTRLLGREDVALATDRAESESWTCTDPYLDCAHFAERHDHRIAATTMWDQAFSLSQELRLWSAEAASYIAKQSIQSWNDRLVGLGRDLARVIDVESNPDPDCPWDRIADSPATSNESMADDASLMSDERKFPEHANIFVFTLGTEMACQPMAMNEEVNAEEMVEDASVKDFPPPVPSPSDRPLPFLEGTAFARDYCIFAPYPLRDPVDVSHLYSGRTQIESKPELRESDSSSVLRLQQKAAVRLQRATSRSLARNMNWLGQSLLKWSSQLESSVRIAEASDGPWMDDIK